jgi:FMN phosphatase YigB (HAD superfamily)
MIKTIVFDIGNVLFGFDPVAILHKLLPTNPYHNEYLTHFINSQLWQDLDRGTLNESLLASTLNALIPDPSLNQNLQLILDNFIYHLYLIDGSRQLFLQLKQCYPIYLLSNFQAVPFSKLRELHPFLYQADGAIVSAHHHLMKPEPAIYTKLIQHYQLTPHETVFIDDLPENIEAAIQLGMKGIVFKSPESTKDQLAEMGVLKN